MRRALRPVVAKPSRAEKNAEAEVELRAWMRAAVAAGGQVPDGGRAHRAGENVPPACTTQRARAQPRPAGQGGALRARNGGAKPSTRSGGKKAGGKGRRDPAEAAHAALASDDVPLLRQLKSGVALCGLLQTIAPDACPAYEAAPKNCFQQLSNIQKFCQALRDKKLLRERHVFRPMDLYKEKNASSVLSTLEELRKVTSASRR
jgi:hypothetical protein